MKILLYFGLFCLFKNIVKTHFQELEYFDDFKPYQVTIFKDSLSEKTKEKNFFCRKISNNVATVIINLSDMENLKANRSMSMPIFKNPRKSAIYIILTNENIHDMVHYVIERIIELSPVPMRPKCLLICWKKDVHLIDNAKKLLYYAWTKNFLDFTILLINKSNSTLMIYYNPFNNTFVTKNILKKNEMFPDKTDDVKKYPLTMPVFNSKPMLWTELENGKIVKVHGNSFGFIDTILNKLNFEANFTLEKNYADTVLYKRMFTSLEENKFRMIPASFLMDSFLYGIKCIVGNTVLESKLVIIVPIIIDSRFNFTMDIFVYMIFLPIIIFIIQVAGKIMKFDVRLWTVLYVYRIFFGQSAKPPRKLSERIIFVLLTVSSLVYSNVFFTSLQDMKIVRYEKKFNSFKDIIDSKMEVHSTFHAQIHDIAEVKKLLLNRIKSENFEDCVQKLIKTRSIVCIVPFNTAKFYVRNNLDAHRRPIMKLAGPSFYYQYASFPYEKASPFAEKFDNIIQRVKESGITKIQKLKENVKVYSSVNVMSSGLYTDIFAEQLIVVLSVGFLSAVLIFSLEMTCYKIFGFKI